MTLQTLKTTLNNRHLTNSPSQTPHKFTPHTQSLTQGGTPDTVPTSGEIKIFRRALQPRELPTRYDPSTQPLITTSRNVPRARSDKKPRARVKIHPAKGRTHAKTRRWPIASSKFR